MLSAAHIADRVSRGAELLDREQPEWAGRISLDDLHMRDCDECVLGQIFGDFTEGVDVLGIADSAYHLGFYGEVRESKLLALVWIAEIERRRGVAKS